MPEKPKYLPAVVPDFRLRTNSEKRRNNLPTNVKPDWPEWVENALFVCWMECGQNVRAALVRLQENWEAFAEPQLDPETGELIELEPPDIPAPTAYRWKRDHDWESKATQVVAPLFPQLTMNLAALLVYQRHSTTRYLIDVVQGRTDAKHDVRVKAADILLEVSGAGTRGNTMRNAPVVREVVSRELDMANMDEESLAELQLQLIREQRAQSLPERTS